MSTTNVDFPEPLTPVTQVKVPMGMRAVMFWRLFSVQPTTSIQPFSLEGFKRFFGIGTVNSPVRYLAVSE